MSAMGRKRPCRFSKHMAAKVAELMTRRVGVSLSFSHPPVHFNSRMGCDPTVMHRWDPLRIRSRIAQSRAQSATRTCSRIVQLGNECRLERQGRCDNNVGWRAVFLGFVTLCVT